MSYSPYKPRYGYGSYGYDYAYPKYGYAYPTYASRVEPAA